MRVRVGQYRRLVRLRIACPDTGRQVDFVNEEEEVRAKKSQLAIAHASARPSLSSRSRPERRYNGTVHLDLDVMRV